jgi:nucleotide-binding universal stress UspA family protein
MKRIKRLFSKTGDEDILVRRSRRGGAARRLERYAEAAALAEGGAQDLAREIIRREIRERPKILVVGHGSTFSTRLVEYAVGLAKRMGYEIVALNCAGFDRERSGTQVKELFGEFKGRAAQGVGFLAGRASEEGVPVSHVVRQESVAQSVRDLEREMSRLQIVLTEPETTRELGAATSIPVFGVTG